MKASRKDRVGELLEGVSRRRRDLISPEGVPLDIQVAGVGERLVAFAIDMALMLGVIIASYFLLIMLFFSRTSTNVGMTLILFLVFVTRTLYFIHFELAWQGRTPGKKKIGLRVINRDGGELKPSAIIARNLTREVEVFLPLSLFLHLDAAGGWQQLCLLAWVAALSALPLFNRDRLRAGDLIGGTQVIAMPKRVLLPDLSDSGKTGVHSGTRKGYSFTHAQLAVYGAFELQVLEEFLRRPQTEQNDVLLREVCRKICAKIKWPDPVPEGETRRFLTDFYAAERAELERGKLFGRLREDKTQAEAQVPNLPEDHK